MLCPETWQPGEPEASVASGARCLPAGSLPPTDIGIAEMPGFPRDSLGQLRAPFRWGELRQPV